jgi:hypothetical protein
VTGAKPAVFSCNKNGFVLLLFLNSFIHSLEMLAMPLSSRQRREDGGEGGRGTKTKTKGNVIVKPEEEDQEEEDILYEDSEEDEPKPASLRYLVQQSSLSSSTSTYDDQLKEEGVVSSFLNESEFEVSSFDRETEEKASSSSSSSSKKMIQREPRQYQLELFHKSLERNVIAYLDTGSGKTFIAVMLIKEMAQRTPQVCILLLLHFFFLPPKGRGRRKKNRKKRRSRRGRGRGASKYEEEERKRNDSYLSPIFREVVNGPFFL